ncbi:DUF4959 domain-containing protein [Puteibacter caeruleilacunae]|nr:DUF4959 domain-containing protein [Puteibacter caeruleilacunae]
MRYLYFTIILAIVFCVACDDEPIGQTPSDATAPGAVSNVSVENISGGAKLTYEVSKDKDLLYVKAVYSIAPGKDMEVKSSYYTNNLLVEGFGDTNAHQVKLYAVDRSGNESEAVTVEVNPLKPNMKMVQETITMADDFGGVNIKWENSNKAELAIVIMSKDSIGEWFDVETLYTGMEEGSYSVRGFNTDPRTFGVVVRDRWENLSDTVQGEFNPLLEIELDKANFGTYVLPTDKSSDYGWPIEGLWDGKLTRGYHTAVGSGMPQQVTIDLGAEVKLSRYKIWQRQDNWIWTHGNPRRWEIWGSVHPAADGSYDGWVKMLDCENVKPSGLPAGENSNEDVALAKRGDEFVFDLNSEPVRYIRLRTLETWSGGDFMHVAEMSFWGQPAVEEN